MTISDRPLGSCRSRQHQRRHRSTPAKDVKSLHVEYAERRRKYDFLSIFSLVCEYSNLEYVWVPVIYRVNQAEYVIRILAAASQEYVNTHSTRRVKRSTTLTQQPPPFRGQASCSALHSRVTHTNSAKELS